MEAFLPHEDGVDCVSFGPRDDLVVISDEGRAIVWDWKRDQQRTFGPEPNQKTTRSAFSADGRSVFVASQGQVTKWDLEQATPRVVIAQLRGTSPTSSVRMGRVWPAPTRSS